MRFDKMTDSNKITAQKILIIDDEAAILGLLTAMLSRKGFQIDTAGSGTDGLKKIQSTSYDLVLTDIKMPGISGKELLTEIRKIRGHTLPVIGMSGTHWLLDVNLFDSVLEKPFTKESLFATIEKITSSEKK